MNRWTKAGVLDRMFEQLRRYRLCVSRSKRCSWTPPTSSSILRAWVCSKNGSQAIGKSRGGWNTKIHLVATNARGAITFSLSPGQVHDAPKERPLLRKLGPPDQQLHLLMDQSCEGNQTRHLALALGYVPVVPSSAKRFDPWEYDRAMYRRRNEFERLFRRLKGYRRILSRWEKLDLMFTGFINFALVTDEAWLVLKQLFRRHQSFGPRCRPKRLVALCLGMRSSVLFQQIPTQAPLARRAHAKACGLLLDDQIRFTQSAK